MKNGGANGRGKEPRLSREQAEQEAWAKQNAYQPNIPPTYDGYWGKEPPQPSVPDWQVTGYHMEPAPCDAAQPVSDQNDENYQLPDYDNAVPPDVDVCPMGSTGVDGSLADQRSRTVREHLGDFWKGGRRSEQAEPASTGAIPPVDSGGDLAVSASVSGVPIRPGGRTLVWVLAVVVVLVAGGILVATELFRVSSITVTGNRTISEQEIIRLSGIKLGDNVLALNEAEIAERIATNRYLKLVCEGHDNHHVTLQVYEREPAAYTVVRGNYYVMDIRGMVLEESATAAGLDEGLICVQNMSVHSCIVGKHIDLYDQEMEDVYFQLMLEFKALSLTDEVKELYLDDRDNLCLTTTSGFYVRLGDETYLHRKLRSMQLTVEKLKEMGYTGGTIDVTVYTKPSYSPDLVMTTGG